jgi:aspartate/methionine/tyrosine aminotransferase
VDYYKCPNGNIICWPDVPCPECIEDDDCAEESITRHVHTCTADGFCYTCQCL